MTAISLTIQSLEAAIAMLSPSQAALSEFLGLYVDCLLARGAVSVSTISHHDGDM